MKKDVIRYSFQLLRGEMEQDEVVPHHWQLLFEVLGLGRR